MAKERVAILAQPGRQGMFKSLQGKGIPQNTGGWVALIIIRGRKGKTKQQQQQCDRGQANATKKIPIFVSFFQSSSCSVCMLACPEDMS